MFTQAQERSEPKFLFKFCAVGNWRPLELTWKCERADFLTISLNVILSAKRFLLDNTLNYIFSFFLICHALLQSGSDRF